MFENWTAQDIANGIAAANWITAITAVLAAIAAPAITNRLNQRSQDRKLKRDTKLFIFGELMSHRHMHESPETVRAFNLIDLAFHDDPPVRRLWQEYHAMISNKNFFANPLGPELIAQKKVELLEKMAQSLGYQNTLNSFDINRVYAPGWLVDQYELSYLQRQQQLAQLRPQQQPPQAPQQPQAAQAPRQPQQPAPNPPGAGA